MGRKAQAAAAGFNQVLEALITADMIQLCQGIVLVLLWTLIFDNSPETEILTGTGYSCIALVPAMQIHLLNSTSAKPLIASLGQHNFDMCMQVADEVRKTYFGAALVRRLFLQAQAQIKSRKTRQEPTVTARQMEGPTLGTRAPHTPKSTASGNQSFTDTDTIKNLGSAFTGFESIQGGYEYVATLIYPFGLLEAD